MLLHHCSNFRAWTSFSSNSWNAQWQGSLSSDSNSSQPSWLGPSDPETWSPSLSGPDWISPPARHNSQHVVDKFFVVSGLIVAKKVLHYQNKCLPRFQFHFVHWVFELWISDELSDLRTVKDSSFQLLHGNSWKGLVQVVKQSPSLSKALVNCLI